MIFAEHASGARPARVIASLDRDPALGIDRLSTALLDYQGAHAAITVSTQSGPAGRGTHQLLSVLGSDGWLRMDYPLAQAQPTRCHIFIGDASSFGGFETSTVSFEPVNQYMLQAERFSRFLLGERCPPGRSRTPDRPCKSSTRCSNPPARTDGRRSVRQRPGRGTARERGPGRRGQGHRHHPGHPHRRRHRGH